MLSRLEYSGIICSLCLLDSNNSCASASGIAGIMGIRCLAQLIFVFLIETGFHHVGQVGSGPTALAPQSAGIMGMSPHAQPRGAFWEGLGGAGECSGKFFGEQEACQGTGNSDRAKGSEVLRKPLLGGGHRCGGQRGCQATYRFLA